MLEILKKVFLATSWEHVELTVFFKCKDPCLWSRIYGRVVSSLSSISGLEFGLGNLACAVGCAEPDADVVSGVRWQS
jgi:hypothetical protein